MRTCVCDSGGVLLAHSVCRLEPVSRSHMLTSLLPCTAETTQDCSTGCVAKRLIRAPNLYDKRYQYYENWIERCLKTYETNVIAIIEPW